MIFISFSKNNYASQECWHLPLKDTLEGENTMSNNADIRSFILAEFPKMKTQEDLLDLLNKVKRSLEGDSKKDFEPLSMKSLNYYKNIKASGKLRYRTFSIKKKSGSLRTINAPCSGLKVFQTYLNYILQVFYPPNSNVCGFVHGRSIADGAKKHVGKRYVLNIDLKDFFDTIEHHRVKSIFTLPPFNLKDDKDNPNSLPYILANLCCHPKEVVRFDKEGNPYQCVRNVTPQGAPTSPIITNLICRQLDRRLIGLAKRFRLAYSRYADDITFSTNSKGIFDQSSVFMVELGRIIEEDQKFRINDEKTRVQSKAYRQEVTGLVVNSKVNVTKRYVKQIRMWLYLWEHYGYEKATACFLRDYNKSKGQAKHGTLLENVLEGKLNYLKMVVGAENVTFKKLAKRFYKINKEINISSLLDIWESDGLDKAIKLYGPMFVRSKTDFSKNKQKSIKSHTESILPKQDFFIHNNDFVVDIIASPFSTRKEKIRSVELLCKDSRQTLLAEKQKQTIEQLSYSESRGLEHDPEFISRFLHQFTEKECQALKFTTHYWDEDSESGEYNYKSFEDFKNGDNGYRKILESGVKSLDSYKALYSDVLRKTTDQSQYVPSLMSILHYRCEHLWKIINNFLLVDDPSKDNEQWKYQWGEHKLLIGYNKFLKKWMDENPQQQPFAMPLSYLPQELIPQTLINGKQLNDFGDVVEIFKHSIEFRDDDLYKAVIKIFKSSDIIVNKELLSTLKGSNFFTDTSLVKEALRIIAGNIFQRSEHPNVEIRCYSKMEADRKRITLEILQVDSYSHRDVTDAKINPNSKEGDLATIRTKLRNLCDFSIESRFKVDGVLKPLRINYLASNYNQYTEREEIAEKECKGFKYLLHFYNYTKNDLV